LIIYMEKGDFIMDNEQSTGHTQTIIVKSPKNVGLAAGLGLFLGPLGMIYSTIMGAVIMLIPFVIIGIIALVTFGVGFVFVLPLLPICAIWSYIAAKRYNRRLLAGEE